MLDRPLARRTALIATAAMTGLAAGACTSDSPDDPSDAISTSAPPVDADQELVTGVAGEIAAMGVLVDSLLQDFPALRGELRPLRRLHSDHLEVVGGFDDSVPTSDPITGGRTAAARELLRSEQQHQRALATAAERAESGTLAKLLASMSAGVAQHVAVLG